MTGLEILYALAAIATIAAFIGTVKIKGKLFKRKPKGPIGAIVYVPPYGWTPIGDFVFEGVSWTKYRERDPVGFSQLHSLGGADRFYDLAYMVSRTPSCPKCGVQLEEQKRPWYKTGKYMWLCVGCGFEKISKISMSVAADRAERVAWTR